MIVTLSVNCPLLDGNLHYCPLTRDRPLRFSSRIGDSAKLSESLSPLPVDIWLLALFEKLSCRFLGEAELCILWESLLATTRGIDLFPGTLPTERRERGRLRYSNTFSLSLIPFSAFHSAVRCLDGSTACCKLSAQA